MNSPQPSPIRLAAFALPWLAAVAINWLAPDYLGLATSVLTMGLFALSLDLALGHAGIVTLGHAAFYGVGAYTAGIFAIHVWSDPLAGLAAATAVASLIGAISGLLILHTSGLTLMMLTLAVASMIAEFANSARDLTGGDDGLTDIRPSPLLGLFKFDLWGHTAYLYALAIVLVWTMIVWRVLGSPFGRSLDGIRQNPARMFAIGTPVRARLILAYALSAAIAGSAGALTAQATKTVSLTSLGVLTSGTVLMVVVLGGLRRRWGGYLGALVYVLGQNFAAEIDPFRWMLIIGVMLIAVVMFFENGLAGLVDLIRKRTATSETGK